MKKKERESGYRNRWITRGNEVPNYEERTIRAGNITLKMDLNSWIRVLDNRDTS